MKKTLLALLVAGAAVNAQAGIQLDTGIALPVSGPGADNVSGSELVLAAYNASTNTSYTRDLGISLGQFDSSANVSKSFAATANLPALSSGWVWGVYAADNSTLSSTAANFGERYMTTVASDQTGLVASDISLNNDNVHQGAGAVWTYFNDLNKNFIAGAGEINTHRNTAVSVNGESISKANNLGNVNNVLGNDLGTGASPFGAATVNVGQNAYFVLANQVNDTTDPNDLNSFQYANFKQYSGVWSLGLNGTLSYTAPTVATPIPAAVWLLGSGLVGLVGVSRRREEEAKA